MFRRIIMACHDALESQSFDREREMELYTLYGCISLSFLKD